MSTREKKLFILSKYVWCRRNCFKNRILWRNYTRLQILWRRRTLKYGLSKWKPWIHPQIITPIKPNLEIHSNTKNNPNKKYFKCYETRFSTSYEPPVRRHLKATTRDGRRMSLSGLRCKCINGVFYFYISLWRKIIL